MQPVICNFLHNEAPRRRLTNPNGHIRFAPCEVEHPRQRYYLNV